MRMVWLGILLIISTTAVADSSGSVIARHWPMHPSNTQAVTFEATAVADRIILSYERFLLSGGPDSTHMQIPVEAKTIVKTCDPKGSTTIITCTYMMPVAFPASSLITYTATAVHRGAVSTRETYSFAAGDYPWPDDPIPIRLKGDTKSKLDTVFIPADIDVALFRSQLDEVIDFYFRYEPLRFWRGLHNFWYSGQEGKYPAYCQFENPANYANLHVIADAVAFLHQSDVRNCTNIPRMSSKIDSEKTIVHENSHSMYRLQDEYCCNTNYKPQACAPNIYASLAACQADAQALGYPPSYCTQLTYETTIKEIWRIDPGNSHGPERPCIMGPNENNQSSVFGAACLRRLNWRYRKCLAGECMTDPECP
ncbi:MAG TPA: hypothetical protein VGQ36_13385 [Thermoanaerobaculia bacterium]|jgi:hypothetical protein|nr:hypothetical protein [Thermoanaerobaculia bacterium]